MGRGVEAVPGAGSMMWGWGETQAKRTVQREGTEEG